MGWWGFNVMEGDAPLDGMGFIVESLSGISNDALRDADDWDAASADRDAKANEKLMTGEYTDVIAAIIAGSCRYCDTHILLQVLGEMIMVAGAPMTDAMRTIAITAATDDVWAPHNGFRKAAMQAYIERVKAYNGTAIPSTNRGLLDTIHEALSEGNTGLVNK